MRPAAMAAAWRSRKLSRAFRSAPAGAGPPPRFDDPKPIAVTLPDGHHWAKAADFVGPRAVVGRVRARFGAAVAAFDANGDARTDLFLASAVVGPEGLRDVLLLNRGNGRFEDATAAFGLPDARASLGVAAGDFDADGHIDLFLTGVGGSQDAMQQIKEGGLYRATFLYNPNMAASAVNMARLIGLDDGFSELVPPEVPRQVVVPAAVVTKDNVEEYEQYAFD